MYMCFSILLKIIRSNKAINDIIRSLIQIFIVISCLCLKMLDNLLF